MAEDAYRDYYQTFAKAYRENLEAAAERGEIRPGDEEARTWALLGMNVFLGMRFSVWDDSVAASHIADTIADLIAHGMAAEERSP